MLWFKTYKAKGPTQRLLLWQVHRSDARQGGDRAPVRALSTLLTATGSVGIIHRQPIREARSLSWAEPSPASAAGERPSQHGSKNDDWKATQKRFVP